MLIGKRLVWAGAVYLAIVCHPPVYAKDVNHFGVINQYSVSSGCEILNTDPGLSEKTTVLHLRLSMRKSHWQLRLISVSTAKQLLRQNRSI